ncbi:hypothetical protein GJAV_G00036890 [Gymnothorax javanicus]|nr:hypothetical protein GJAV_G00036890 [Gymnothorax javanicus]
MAREQQNTSDLLVLLDSSELSQREQVMVLIIEQLSSERGSVLLNGLVDYYMETNSSQALQILTSVREPHDKHLLDKLNECLARPAARLHTLTLLGHIVRKQPPWIHKITRFPVLTALLRCLKTDSDVLVLITGVLVLITLLPMIPQAGRQHLYDFFDIFGRLAAWNLRNPGHVTEVFLIHLHASVYSLFHRLYGMYPCNFISYLRSHYNMKENVDTFREVVKPMLEHVRIHPELVTGTKEHELDPTRWKKFEVHDIVIECAKVSLDPKEASCEEGYSNTPDHSSGSALLQLRPTDPSASPYADLLNSYGSYSSNPLYTSCQTLPPISATQPLHDSLQSSQPRDPLWSPSSICGLATPPSSRGISPTNAPGISQSACLFTGRSHARTGKGSISSSTDAGPSPHPPFSEGLSLPPNTAAARNKVDAATESCKPCLTRQEPIRDLERDSLERDSSTDDDSRAVGVCENVPMNMNMMELSAFMKEQDLQQQESTEEAIAEELFQITQEERDGSVLREFDSLFYRTTETLTGAREQASPAALTPTPPCPGHTPSTSATVFTPIDHPACPLADTTAPLKYELSVPSICQSPSLPYKDLLDLALPKATSLFIGRRSAEATWRAGEGQSRGEVQEEACREGEVPPFSALSPLEALDRLIQQGNDVHNMLLKRLPLPSKSADWTHFGAGLAPQDELQMLRSQLLLLHSQLLYERYKREQHALRNRRLLRRIINGAALQEQNKSMKERLSLKKVDMAALKESLRVEQQRFRQLWTDRETLVSCLHNQIRQLQQGRDECYNKNQELQRKLVEYQKRIDELEAELQGANYTVCSTEHQLSQLSVKVSHASECTDPKVAMYCKLRSLI